MQDAPVAVGDILAGKYRIEKVLGQGGMGVVVAATHVLMDKKVALKFMLGEAAASTEFTARFLREAKTAGSLDTQHVAKVLDVGLLDDGAPFMVLEHLNGTDLMAIIEANGPVPIEYACEYVMQAAIGMAAAHSKDIIHRDLKPANLFLTTTDDGQTLVKILDFGIAKAAIDSLATKTQAVMGAPLYMSPEQMRSAKNVDARADIWSLGATLYHLLTGTPPFSGDTMPLLCIAILTEPPTPFDKTGVQVPEELQAVILRCLDKELGNRPQSASELAAMLAPFSISNPTITAPPLVPSGDGAASIARSGSASDMVSRYGVTTLSASTSQVRVPETPSPAASSSLRKRFAIGLGGAVLIGAGVVGLTLLSGDKSDKEAAVAVPIIVQDASAQEPAPSVAPAAVEMAMLKISSDPPGAEVFVNDEPVGETPIAIQREMGSTQSLRVVAEGYETVEAEVTIEALAHKESFSLKKAKRSSGREKRRRKRR